MFKYCIVLLMLLCCCGILQAQTSLTKGYQFFVDNGLQLQALGSANNWGGINVTNWANSGYDVFFNSYHILDGGGIDWGFVVYDVNYVNDLTSNEKSSLKFAQYKDEENLTTPGVLADLTAGIALIKTKVPNAITYTNLNCFDNYTVSQLNTYIQTAKPDMLCFTEYRFLSDLSYNTPMYSDLMIQRTAARAGLDGTGSQPIPLSMFLQRFYRWPSTEWRDHQPSESEMRLQQFVGWAYGYKSSNAFVYAAPNKDNIGDVDGVAFDEVAGQPSDTNPNAAFYKIAGINSESKNLSPVLSRLMSTDVRMIMGKHGSNVNNPLPSGMQVWTPGIDSYITSISATNNGTTNNGQKGDVVIGYFEPLLDTDKIGNTNADTYFMIVNGLIDPNPNGTAADCQQTIHLVMNFGSTGMNSLFRQSRLTGEVEEVGLVSLGGGIYSLDLVLDGGTGDLFKFNNGTGLMVPWAGVTIYEDNFNRVDNPSLGTTSDDLYSWIEDIYSYNDCARIYNNVVSMGGYAGYGKFYVDNNLDLYEKYQINFDLFVANGVVMDPQPLFKILPRNPVGGTLGWEIRQTGDANVVTGQRAIKVEFNNLLVSGDVALTGVWKHVQIDVNDAQVTLKYGNLVDVRVTDGSGNDGVADFLSFLYVWDGEPGLNFQIDNLRVSSLATPACGDTLHPYPLGDINQDCYVNFADIALFVENWLYCTSPSEPCSFNP